MFIVEGGKNEFNILKQIFCGIFRYSYIEKRRTGLEKFYNPNNENSKIAVINTLESNINTITDGQDYLDSLFDVLREKYHFPVEQSAIYYLFDRDPKSNTDTKRIQDYIKDLKNPYENGDLMGGQFLLSYPSIESHVISNFEEDVYCIGLRLGSDAKSYIVNHNNIQLNKFSEETIVHAADEFIKFLQHEKIAWDIDRISDASMSIYNIQEAEYKKGNGYKLFSMLAAAFLQMGIIEFE